MHFLSSVFKLHSLTDDVVVILSVIYWTSSRVISVLACILPENLDVVPKALSFLFVYWG